MKRPPRNNIYSPITISLETKETLTAIAYQLGYKGMVARVAKQLVFEGIKRYLDGLSVPKRAQYNQILANVKIESQFNPPRPRKKPVYKYVKKKLRGGV